MRRAERLAAFAFLLTAAPACRADTLPPQIYFTTFVVNAVPLGIAPDASGAAYLLTDDGIVSRVSTQGVVSAAGRVPGYPSALAVNPTNGAVYVTWSDPSNPNNNYVSRVGAGIDTLLPPQSFPFVSGVAVDTTSGHVYVLETYFHDTTQNGDGVLLFQELDANLNLLPNSATVDDGASADLEAFYQSAAVDPAGSVYGVASRCQNPTPPDRNQSCNLLAVKYSPHLGALAYRSPIDITSIPTQSYSYSDDIAVDAAGEAYLGGSTYLVVPGARAGVLSKVSAAGSGSAVADTTSLGAAPQSNQQSSIQTVAADAASNAYVLAAIQDAAGTHVQAVKYGPGGDRLWNARLSDTASVQDQAIAVDGRNAIYTAIKSKAGNSIYLAKYGAPSTVLGLAAVGSTEVDATPTKTLTTPLKVTVTRGGQPAAGVTVRWDFTSLPNGTTGQDLLEVPGFPSTVVASRDVPTNANGESDVQVRLGNMTGDYVVAAQVADSSPAQTSFTLHGQLFFKIDLSTYSIFPVTGSFSTGGYISDLNKTTVTVTAYGAGGLTDAVTGYPLVLVSTYVVFSGGHDHEDGRRPIGVYELGSGLAAVPGGVAGQTDGRGVLTAVYRSSWTGGYEVLAASSSFDANLSSTQTVTIKVPGLVLLPDSDLYVKIGGTCNHHGPSDSVPARCQTPDHDHWASTMVAAGLPLVAADYSALEEVAAQGLPSLRVNDISLPFGGLLDVGGHWHPPHELHRLGMSVDVRASPPNADGVPLRLRGKLSDIVKKEIDARCSVRIHSQGTTNQHFHIECSGTR